jgi:hypothetical protein
MWKIPSHHLMIRLKVGKLNFFLFSLEHVSKTELPFNESALFHTKVFILPIGFSSIVCYPSEIVIHASRLEIGILLIFRNVSGSSHR